MERTSPITELKNVGEQRAKKLQRMGIETIGDLLEHYPRDYKDRSRLTKIADLSETDENTFLARVKGEGQTGRRGRLTFTRLQVFDDTDEITLLWYNQPYMKTALKSGEVYLFTGRMQKKYNRREIVSPEYESIKDNFAGGRIVPVYPSVDGISQKMLRSYLEEALKQVSGTLTEELPLWIRKKYHLAEKNFAQTNIHFPRTEEAFYDARRRLVFEEFFLLQTALFSLREELLGRGSGIVMEHPEAMDEFQKSLPFSMTNAQKKVLSEIAADMTSGKIMSRLVQGDVGSGKTAVAMAAAYWAIQNGYQAVLMAPTEVLAEQHGKSFTELFAPLGIEVALLTGSMKAKEKREALAKIADGTAQMIVGTHAVIQKGVEYHKIGLVITDEQHRFGVEQRSRLWTKNAVVPHVLVMTATPIPRTLAMTLYGDLDVSVIDELPPGRKPIQTVHRYDNKKAQLYDFLRKEIGQGRQVYVVYPLIEGSEKLDYKNLEEGFETFKEVFPEYKVCMVHGKMKAADKEAEMQKFISGEAQILMATTVIEVGVNVPNASVMVIESAERFGLSQLHQLRGRVGRGAEQSYCVLVSSYKLSNETRKRLEIMVSSNNGFEIAEADLRLRGHGDLEGTRQSGEGIDLKIANLAADGQILQYARDIAQDVLNEDPDLLSEPNRILNERLKTLFAKKVNWGMIS